jgi:hypothetical protein
MWNEAVMTYFEILCRHVSEGISMSQDKRSARRDLKTGTPEYKVEMLTSRRHQVLIAVTCKCTLEP